MIGRFDGLRIRMATTAGYNVAVAAIAGLTGVVIARVLGPGDRGAFAAVVAWSGVVVTVGQLGQAAATTYIVARATARTADYLVTARNMMVCWGGLVAAGGIVAAPLLASGSDTQTTAHRLMFLACLLSFAGVAYTFGLHAVDLPRWNLVRTVQPATFLAAVVLLVLTGPIDLVAVAAALAVTVAAQPAVAYVFCQRRGLTGGRASRSLARPMARYGLGQLAASGPGLIVSRLDQLVLSLAVAPAVLGHYAVAASISALAVPIVAALGYVAFPILAARRLSRARTALLERRAVLASAAIGTALVSPVAVAAPWLVPAVFGAGYAHAVPLVWILAPSGVLTGCTQVCADLLNGRGRPLVAARAQAVASVATIVLLAVLVPRFGAMGAAVASTVASGIGLSLMLRSLFGASTDGGTSRPSKQRLRASEACPPHLLTHHSPRHREWAMNQPMRPDGYQGRRGR